eukprot:Em0015g916a
MTIFGSVSSRAPADGPLERGVSRTVSLGDPQMQVVENDYPAFCHFLASYDDKKGAYSLHVVFNNEKEFLERLWSGEYTGALVESNSQSSSLATVGAQYSVVMDQRFPVQEAYLDPLFIRDCVEYCKSPGSTVDGPRGTCHYAACRDGFDESFMNPLRDQFLLPIARLLFPEWVGKSLDSHRAFIVQYSMGNDTDLRYHYDNAEVTLNVCLGKTFMGGDLYFGPMKGAKAAPQPSHIYQHRLGRGILHRGYQMHGAHPITAGERCNFIMWMRSSSVRNPSCPMCDHCPQLVPASDTGDGLLTSNEDHVTKQQQFVVIVYRDSSHS